MSRNRVILVPSPAMTTSASWSALRRKRHTLWHHAARNQLIARVGMACLEQDKPTLREMGIPAKKKTKDGLWTFRVAILVENTEHASALESLLPGWELLDTVPTSEPMDDPEEEGDPLASGVIVTWMRCVRHDLNADYLIRATGWRGRIGLDGPDNWLATRKRRVTVIDFADGWDLQARMDTEVRVREYSQQRLDVIWNKDKMPVKL